MDIDNFNYSVALAAKLIQQFAAKSEKNLQQIKSKLDALKLHVGMASSLADLANQQIRAVPHSNMVLILSVLKSLILWLTNEEENEATMIKIMKSAAKLHGKLPTKLEGFELIYDNALRGLEDTLKDLKKKFGVKDDGAGMLYRPREGSSIFFSYSNCFDALFGDDSQSKIISSQEWSRFFRNHPSWIVSSLKVPSSHEEEDDDDEEDDDENVTFGEIKMYGTIEAATKAKQKPVVMKKTAMKKSVFAQTLLQQKGQIRMRVKSPSFKQPVSSKEFVKQPVRGYVSVSSNEYSRTGVKNPYFKG